MSWDAALLEKLDTDQDLMERIRELQGRYSGLPHDTLNMNRFQREVTRLIVSSGYPPMKPVANAAMEGRFMFSHDDGHVVPVPAPLQVTMMEAMADKLQIKGDENWRRTVTEYLVRGGKEIHP